MPINGQCTMVMQKPEHTLTGILLTGAVHNAQHELRYRRTHIAHAHIIDIDHRSVWRSETYDVNV